MTLNKFCLLLSIGLFIGACAAQQNGDSNNVPTSTLPNGTTLAPLTGNNVMNLTVNGSLCSAGSYPNKPCVSVTVCSAEGTNCQTVNDILLDTGSYGLRVFKTVLNSGVLPPAPSATAAALAECVQFGDGSSDWGPVETVSVVLGDEPAVQIPIQVIDSTFSSSSAYCNGADTAPSEAGFNGILGVGPFPQDCGSACATTANNGMYFSCTGATCTDTTAALAAQVQNPVALLPQDNNGVIVELPSVPLGGVTSADGYVVLGIGTEGNNAPSSASSSVNAYALDPTYGELSTVFNGQIFSTSFMDTGSNGIFFTAPSASSLPDCTGNFAGFFCPGADASFIGMVVDNTGVNNINVPFEIGNASTLESGSTGVFVELGGDGSGIFDWGLPFHLGRNVYMQMDNTASPLGTGPLVAF